MDPPNSRNLFESGNNSRNFPLQSHSPGLNITPSRSTSVDSTNNNCVSLNSVVNNGNISSSNNTNANPNQTSNPLMNLGHLYGAGNNNANGLYRHIPAFDSATAALLMNPAAAAAAVASVAQQIVAAQQQQQQHQHVVHQHRHQGKSNVESNNITNTNNTMSPPSSAGTQQQIVNSSPNVMHSVPSPGPLSVHQMGVSSIPQNAHNNLSIASAPSPGAVDVNQALAVLSNAGLIKTHSVHNIGANNNNTTHVNSVNHPIVPVLTPTPRLAPAPSPIAGNMVPSAMNAVSSTTINNNKSSKTVPKAPVVMTKKNSTNHSTNHSLVNIPSTTYFPQVVKTTVPRLPNPMSSSPHHSLAKSIVAGKNVVAMNGNPLENMRTWSLKQLDDHVRLLREASQPLPQPLALLLADARRKEEKKTAKRVANRKSACTSRARKKALVEEMTRTNQKLRRQALILSLLPDLVLAITVEGEITFCSAQVERVLRHNVDDLVGSNLLDILLPVSKDALVNLIGVLVTAERNERENSSNDNSRGNNNNTTKNDGNGGDSASGGSSNGVAVISEQSFPLSVVKVMGSEKIASSKRNNNNNGETISNSSGSGAGNNNAANPSSSMSRSNSSYGNSSNQSGSDEDNRDGKNRNGRNQALNTTSQNRGASPSEDSSESKMRASESLNRNVQYHKDQLGKHKLKHKDDVTGASVTANNAGARLSSLQHCPKNIHQVGVSDTKCGTETSVIKKKQKLSGSDFRHDMEEHSTGNSESSDSLLSRDENRPAAATGARPCNENNENASEDSGYREEDRSREESGSSGDESSNSIGDRNASRPKPLAPTCNICLIRDDLTTIWCEVTSSIRTRSLTDEIVDPSSIVNPAGTATRPKSADCDTLKQGENSEDPPPQEEQVKELLLCLRPIREGEEKVTEELKFQSNKAREELKLLAASSPLVKKLSQQEYPQASSNANVAHTSKKLEISGVSPMTAPSATASSVPGATINPIKRPMKKRPFFCPTAVSNSSRKSACLSAPTASNNTDTTTTEKSVAESLMLMCSTNSNFS